MANAEQRGTVLIWRVAGDAFLQVLAGSRQHTKAERRDPEGKMGDDRVRGVVGTLREAQQRFPNLAHRVELRPSKIKPPQTIQDWNDLWGLADLLTQFARPSVGVFHLGCGKPFRYLQCSTEGNVQR